MYIWTIFASLLEASSGESLCVCSLSLFSLPLSSYPKLKFVLPLSSLIGRYIDGS